jgi:hypothetical protein
MFRRFGRPRLVVTATTEQVLRVRILGDEPDDLDVGAHGRSPGDTFFVQHELASAAARPTRC